MHKLVGLGATALLVAAGFAGAVDTGGTVLEDRTEATETGVDPEIPTLRYSVLKAGFRVIVSWTTSTPAVGEVTWSVSGGPDRTTRESTPQRDHAFVFKHLPAGGEFTFAARYEVPSIHGQVGQAVESLEHTVPLQNVNRGVGPDRGYHTVNLTVLANENPAYRDNIEAGIDRFAEVIWDGTDGNVAIANVTLMYDDLRHSEAGIVCAHVLYNPACVHSVDVTFSYDMRPYASASTFGGGIEDPQEAIYMNNLYEGHDARTNRSQVEEIASVLAHEFGHYAFWMDEAYDVVPLTTCHDPETDISIMGFERGVTEFDGPNATCPQGSFGELSWSTLRERYAGIPFRPDGPDPGPHGPGPAYELRVLDFTTGRTLPDRDVAVAVSEDAHGAVAVSATGDASGWFVASGTGDADGAFAAASGLGNATGYAAASATGNNSGTYVVSGTGDATSCRIVVICIAASGTGDASGGTAVSVTGEADGSIVEVSGCEAVRKHADSDALCMDPDGNRGAGLP